MGAPLPGPGSPNITIPEEQLQVTSFIEIGGDGIKMGDPSLRDFMMLWPRGVTFIITSVGTKRQELGPGRQLPFLPCSPEVQTDTSKTEELKDGYAEPGAQHRWAGHICQVEN